MINDRDCKVKLNFLCLKKIICINVFCYENKLTYPVYLSDQEFESCMDLLMITSKVLTDLCAIKQSVKIKKNFVDIVYNFLVVKKF